VAFDSALVILRCPVANARLRMPGRAGNRPNSWAV